MKAIITGLRYDTDKAVLIGEATADVSRTDFHWWEAGLYRTKCAGRYFLAGRGGPMSRFSRSAGQNSWTGGSGIHPMTREEALEWAERYLTTAEVESGFGEQVEDA